MMRPIREAVDRIQSPLNAVQILTEQHRRMISHVLELQQRLRPLDSLEFSGINNIMSMVHQVMAPIQEATAQIRAVTEAARRLDAFPEASRLLMSETWGHMATIRAITAGFTDLIPPAVHADMVAASAMAESQAEWLPEARQRSFLVDAITVVNESVAADAWDNLSERLEASLADHLETAQSGFEAAWILALYHWLINNLVGIVSLIITCIGLLQNQQSSLSSDIQHAEYIKALGQIEKAIPTERPKFESPRQFLEIHVPCVMSHGMAPSSPRVADILPGERLEVLHLAEGRAKVALYDRIRGRTLVGWIDATLIQKQ